MAKRTETNRVKGTNSANRPFRSKGQARRESNSEEPLPQSEREPSQRRGREQSGAPGQDRTGEPGQDGTVGDTGQAGKRGQDRYLGKEPIPEGEPGQRG